MRSDQKPEDFSRSMNNRFTLEWVLTILAAINCIFAVGYFALINSPNLVDIISSQWPLPFLYFIEIIAIGIAGVIAMTGVQIAPNPRWSAVFWICSGLLLTFVILGAWTIGFFLLPAMIINLVVGILTGRRTGSDIPRHLIYFVAAGIGQATLVFLTLLG
jgi:hypothetical protein